MYHAAQSRTHFFISVIHDRFFKFLPEALVSIKEAWHQEIKNTPEFTETVFHRSSRQRHPESTLDQTHTLCRLGTMVFDVLRFIDHLICEPDILVACNIAFQKVIGCDPDIPIFLILDHFLPLCRISCNHLAGKLRHKLADLFFPVVYKRSRSNDQRPQFISCLSFLFLR